MKSKRGFLLAEETLKILIALICITFLVYFLTSLYMKNKESQNLEFAKNTLQDITVQINSGNSEVFIYNPSGWYLMSFSKNNLPKTCLNLAWQNCLCICDSSWKPWAKEKDECDNAGYCIESDLGVEKKILKDLPLKLNIDLEHNLIK